ncbi:MAG: adenylyltransferase/cytidyltransferase family protein [Minisyncoccota bacterium]
MGDKMTVLPSIRTILQDGNGLSVKYIPEFGRLERVVTLLKESGYTIVLTQGVYDMFHVGHKRYLEEAGKQGNILIVGVDSDELTRETKGKIDPTRPFDSFESRIEIISALSFVKIVTRRHIDQHTDDLIKLVRPDVLVISKTTSSFTSEKISELKEFCGRVEHLEAKADPSVTSTTAKLKRLRTENGKELGDQIMQAVQKVVRSYLGDGDQE